jgi:hypothetical protein
MDTQSFRMAYWKPLLPLLFVAGAGPSTTSIVIEHDVLRVTMGWFWFRATVPLRCIVHARRSANAWFSVGIHTDAMRGWIVNGSPLGMVHLTIEPAATGRFAGLPIRVSNLWLSLEDPDGFIQALRARGAGPD